MNTIRLVCRPAPGWTRNNAKGNQYLYNEGSELNAAAGWYETMFRGYDPALGRFLQVDPLAYETHDMSPYQYGNNDPVLLNDPLGLIAQADFDKVVNTLMGSQYGGTWSDDGGGGGSMSLFSSDADAANWAMDNIASLGATEQYAYTKLQGIATGLSWVHNKYLFNITTKSGRRLSLST